jgi:exopolyphosphatase/guanosine-5'-triphosphate,3'-diphosphate pyrophosphatase
MIVDVSEARPRYEFRIWADSLAGLCEKLQELAPGPEMAGSRETYLVAASDKCNAKIRSGVMDIKVLIGTDRGLEQWKPMLKAGFPLERSVIDEQIFPALEIEAPPMSGLRYPIEQFLEVIGGRPEIAVVNVSKMRLRFRFDSALAEFTSTIIDGIARDTVAVDSVDPDAALELIRLLGIGGAPNTSYVREIKNVLGR